jgi:hypothetical protein
VFLYRAGSSRSAGLLHGMDGHGGGGRYQALEGRQWGVQAGWHRTYVIGSAPELKPS